MCAPNVLIWLSLIPDCPDTESLDLVREIISVNAMVNTAVVSPLSEADFHDKSEGLGVLCRLPPEPGSNDSEALLQKLRGVLGYHHPLARPVNRKTKAHSSLKTHNHAGKS